MDSHRSTIFGPMSFMSIINVIGCQIDVSSMVDL